MTGEMNYQTAIKHGAHLFSLCKASKHVTDSSMESEIMAAYAELTARTFEKMNITVVEDIMRFHQMKGLP